MIAHKIPVTVITGFLGAGKTTIIRNLLQTAGGKRIALIINEFGDLGVDGEVLKGCGEETCTQDDIVELTNGCICCTVADDFVPTITQLLGRENKPDHIVIETSGLALPQPLVNAFNWPEIREQVTVDGVVTVVDSRAVGNGQFVEDVEKINQQRVADEALDHESPLEELFGDQLTCADMIILNKADLVEEKVLADIEADINGRVKSSVKLLRASNGSLPASVLLGLEADSQDDMHNRLSRHDQYHHDHDDEEPHHSHEHDHDDFVNFVVEPGAVGEKNSFTSSLDSIIEEHDILRLKGFVEVKNKPMRLVVQAVGSRIDSYFDREWAPDETPATRLVVIGLEGLNQQAVASAIEAAARQAG
ncbi:MAG: cobalamin biosynthesis protein CobW [Hyphomicrobiales bacterium]|nr:cobalamin biosynthesis protein CobW [Hyphomicrobiales bacterium]